MKVLDLELGDKAKCIGNGKTYIVVNVVELVDRIFVGFLPTNLYGTEHTFSATFTKNCELDGVFEIIELAEQ